MSDERQPRQQHTELVPRGNAPGVTRTSPSPAPRSDDSAGIQAKVARTERLETMIVFTRVISACYAHLRQSLVADEARDPSTPARHAAVAQADPIERSHLAWARKRIDELWAADDREALQMRKTLHILELELSKTAGWSASAAGEQHNETISAGALTRETDAQPFYINAVNTYATFKAQYERPAEMLIGLAILAHAAARQAESAVGLSLPHRITQSLGSGQSRAQGADPVVPSTLALNEDPYRRRETPRMAGEGANLCACICIP